MPTETHQRVYDWLHRMPKDGLAAAKQLFGTELNYDYTNISLSHRDWPDRARNALAEAPTLLARHDSQFGSFDIIYARLAQGQHGRDFPLSLTAERLVVNQLLPNHPYSLFVFSDPSEQHWHLLNVRYDKNVTHRRVFRRIAVGPYERLRTASERISLLDLATISSDLFGLSPIAIQQRHDEAFDVEAVTGQFFQEYKVIFSFLQSELARQTGDTSWAHDFALQFINRLMFLYYVQRKRWLGNDPDFLAHFWQAYQKASRPADTFVGEWLSVLLFEAFRNQFQAGRSDRQYLPSGIRNALAMSPYLNGGLFEPNDLDRGHIVSITDAQFAKLFNFLERYNFTISEDTPLDQQVAVDPEMIGKVYESLVNVSEEADTRGEAGIFYTPRVEIDLMCRLALVDWLTNHLGAERKSLLSEAIFAFDEGDKQQADAALAAQDLWPRLEGLLRNITVVDPACGSGSFLVGMLHILDDLLARADGQLGQEETPYERKKRIIGNSLYGVDVMEWAVHVAELRLWLQLVIGTDLEPAELKFRPLLPNLSLKVRPGDSLVQEVGGINLAVRHGDVVLPALKGRVTYLKGEKLKFYNNVQERQYHSAEALQQAELQLFREILDARAHAIDNRLKEIADALRPQVNLFGEVQSTQMQLDQAMREQERGLLQTEAEQVKQGRQILRATNQVPFVWDIAFVEVFEGEKGGFDIVVGNPPYVRQEMIRDPHLPVERVTLESKKAYKDKLIRSVYTAWPDTFGYSLTTGIPRWKLAAKSDLYIYFYFHGLSLLNNKGVFCLITSNSWLDVGYGRDLQEFLLTRGQVNLVLDNQARRSFTSADVNTVIVLLGPPQDVKTPRPVSLEHTARFVMLTVPFEQVLSPVIWQEVEDAVSRRTTPEYCLVPVKQSELLVNGMDPEQKAYMGEKWGAKYLRAPDIYWTIIEKGKDKWVRLANVAEVQRGFTTGANEFFYLDETEIAEWNIEEAFLAWHLDTPRECYGISVSHSACTRLFLCNLPIETIKGTHAAEYIRWGERQGYHERSTCKSRSRWYDLGRRLTPIAAWPRTFFERHICYEMPAHTYCSDRLYGLSGDRLTATVMACLNSTYASLMVEVDGYQVNHGGIDTSVWWLQTLPVLDGKYVDLERVYACVRSRNIELARRELSLPDRRELDEVIFSILGLPLSLVDDLYEAVQMKIADRIHKARRELTRMSPQ